MPYRSRFAALMLLFASTVVAQQAAHEPITEDLSKGATFTFQIGPDLREFTFKVIPELQKQDPEGNPQSTIHDVLVFRGKSNEPVQSLADCEWLGMETPYRGSDWFRVQDINFDGYADIFVLTSWGATGNETGCVWLFNPKSGRFEFSREFSELGTYTLDPATKTITTRGHAGADTIEAAKYVVENNRPVLIIAMSQYFDSDKQEYHCVIQQRRGRQNELLTKRDLWAKSLEDACDPTDPFGRVGDK
jgi:hypothetical protein